MIRNCFCLFENQANAMVERIGYPEFILNDGELDAMYSGVSVRYFLFASYKPTAYAQAIS